MYQNTPTRPHPYCNFQTRISYGLGPGACAHKAKLPIISSKKKKVFTVVLPHSFHRASHCCLLAWLLMWVGVRGPRRKGSSGATLTLLRLYSRPRHGCHTRGCSTVVLKCFTCPAITVGTRHPCTQKRPSEASFYS